MSCPANHTDDPFVLHIPTCVTGKDSITTHHSGFAQASARKRVQAIVYTCDTFAHQPHYGEPGSTELLALLPPEATHDRRTLITHPHDLPGDLWKVAARGRMAAMESFTTDRDPENHMWRQQALLFEQGILFFDEHSLFCRHADGFGAVVKPPRTKDPGLPFPHRLTDAGDEERPSHNGCVGCSPVQIAYRPEI